MFDPDRDLDSDWREEVLKKAGAAESRFQQGKQITPQDTIAMALVHPESFEIMVRLKEGR